ncbi:MAG: preprotein translocase, YajC subunit [Phenylobacterium sp.]|jgi:preprotein translocase subunit YajC|nr:preprotein translocase, YajC subunit [Phenylobacterium sp.]
MFATPAFAQPAVGASDPAGFLSTPLGSMLPIVAIMILFYFLMIRPQQRRMKAHQQAVSAVKRGDVVVLPSGVIGKVVRVEDAEVGVEIATGVTVKVVKSMISEVRTRGEPAPANDSKR